MSAAIDPQARSGRSVPSRRLSRLWHIGRATTDLAAGVGVRGMLELARSRRSGEVARIQLSPEATRRFTDRLARMRGAVMKMGQLMSMDGTDMFTPEAAEIMAELRDRSEPMPMSQLTRLLEQEWGRDWNKAFRRFEFKPVAAASIGQVHRAETKDGRRLALKIQFPGVRESIDSDIDNLGFFARNLGMVPKGMDIGPLLEEARVQLHQEADYKAEAASLMRYRALVGDDGDFFVPAVHEDLSTDRILAMDFADGVSIDHLAESSYSREERDRAASLLVRLMLRELFDFGLAQTDPNFGNYLYDAQTGRIVLLDFGAALPVPGEIAEQYLALGRAAIAHDEQGLREASMGLGYMAPDADAATVKALIEMIRLSSEVLEPGIYDFGTSDLFERLYVKGRDMYMEEAFNHLPEPITMFLQRKFAGMFMLCRRLRARVDLRGMLDPYL
ncbi:AarF/ABC1/UbiB kinase family protein [Thiohalocapsa sp.]|jgi:predicted unusual protein kinase regulating ubiquinone biosynthesis (AarF/ABC1/UbiB family)|uniref:ABC1 kinase family protein n=1 Tax=Thiohalocapsa sp. TaxID=2497641 RepID=UPI0025D2C87F|nr:AarF/ABC1/UbiB kinase family protein [Thiohalocapsa sp.]